MIPENVLCKSDLSTHTDYSTSLSGEILRFTFSVFSLLCSPLSPWSLSLAPYLCFSLCFLCFSLCIVTYLSISIPDSLNNRRLRGHTPLGRHILINQQDFVQLCCLMMRKLYIHQTQWNRSLWVYREVFQDTSVKKMGSSSESLLLGREKIQCLINQDWCVQKTDWHGTSRVKIMAR